MIVLMMILMMMWMMCVHAGAHNVHDCAEDVHGAYVDDDVNDGHEIDDYDYEVEHDDDDDGDGDAHVPDGADDVHGVYVDDSVVHAAQANAAQAKASTRSRGPQEENSCVFRIPATAHVFSGSCLKLANPRTSEAIAVLLCSLNLSSLSAASVSKGDADAAYLPVLNICTKGMFFLDPTDTVTFGYGRTPKESALAKETRLGHDLSSHPGGTGVLASHLQGGGKVGDDHR